MVDAANGALSGSEFRRLALREARRYGADDWVFLRELIQNSRDAGASRVEVFTVVADGVERITCRDDGAGMPWEEARRYLLTLYSSGKTAGAAGRFGVGFWSVLRFAPDLITIRSRPRGGSSGWELKLAGDLESLDVAEADMGVGTEVVLERRVREGKLGAAVRNAVRTEARHCRQLEDPDAVLDISVDGQRMSEPLPTWSPGLRFSASGVRGVVGFADQPSVQLLAHGLRVRRFATLEDLRNPASATVARLGRSRSAMRVMLDCDRLGVLMSRRDVAESAEVERAVRLAERAVDRLIHRTTAPTAVARVVMRLRRLGGWRSAAALGGTLALSTALLLAGRAVGPLGAASGSSDVVTDGNPVARPETEGVLARLADAYRGPGIAPVGRRSSAPGITYRPVGDDRWFGAFRVIGIDDRGRPVLARPGELQGSISATGPETTVRLDGRRWHGPGRLPVPTGMTVVPGSVRVDDRVLRLGGVGDGDAWVDLPVASDHDVEYRVAPVVATGASGPWPDLGEELGRVAAMARGRPLDVAVALCTEAIARTIDYRRDDAAVASLADALRAQGSVCRAAEQAGVGDCDVINTVLAAMLAEAGHATRLAVGWVGTGGVAGPGLHAWVEVDGGGGRWLPVDATAGGPTPEAPGGQETESATVVEPAGPRRSLRELVGLAAFVVVVVATVWWRRLVRDGVRVEAVRPGNREDLAALVADRLARVTTGGSESWLDREPVIPRCGRWPLTPKALATRAQRSPVAMMSGRRHRRHRGLGRGLVVLDGDDPVGRAAAEVVDAVDLDAWAAKVEAAGDDALCQAVNRLIEDAGSKARIALSEDASGDLEAVPLRHPGNAMWCLVRASAPWWQGLVRLSSTDPERAALFGALRVTEALVPASRAAYRVRQRGLAAVGGARG
jgi:hypothetical protein